MPPSTAWPTPTGRHRFWPILDPANELTFTPYSIKTWVKRRLIHAVQNRDFRRLQPRPRIVPKLSRSLPHEFLVAAAGSSMVRLSPEYLFSALATAFPSSTAG